MKSKLDARWLVLFSVGISTFMSALDGSVVNIISPIVAQAFQTGLSNVEWVITIYLLVLSSLLLSFGRLGDLYGNKRVYISGFVIFLLGSTLCGLAPSVTALVAFRALQALGAAMISSNSPAILTKSFPPEQRGQALGLQATMTYLGLTVGPSLGGFLAGQFSWRWVFYINMPVGLLAVLLGLRYIPEDRPTQRTESFDMLGAGVFMVGLVLLLLGLNQGSAWGWSSIAVMTLLGFSIVLGILFVYLEGRVKAPMLDLTLFHSGVFSLAVVSAIFNYICVYTILFLMPFYLIEGRNFTSGQAGLILTAQPVIMAIVAPISGALSDRLGTRWPSTVGMGFLALGMFMLSRLGPGSTVLQVMLALAVAGFGTGTFISPNNSALMGAAPRYRQGVAAGMLATARNFGMVLGVGLAGAIYSTVLTSGPEGPGVLLFRAFSLTFSTVVAVALLGMGTSALRGAPRTTT